MTDQQSPALKEIFNPERLQHIASEMTAVYPSFEARRFLKLAKSGLADLSVMQRMARVSECLHAVYDDAVKVLQTAQEARAELARLFESDQLQEQAGTK